MFSRRFRLPIGGVALALAAFALVSCGSGEGAQPAAAPMAAGAPAAPPAAQLTDPQIAAIAYGAGEIDIKAARLALRKSRNPEVRRFANEMIRDHTAVNRQALALVKKLNVTPEQSDTSRSIQAEADKEYATLNGLRGPEFNRAYADNEVKYHQEVNGALQNTLIPSAQNPELKALLGKGLKIFQGHEQMAEQLAAGLH